MFTQSRQHPPWPRRYAWFIVLLGLLTVAHLWSHAIQIPDHVGADMLMAASHSEPEHDDHGEEAHSHLFVTSVVSGAPHRQSQWAAVAVQPRDAERDLAPVPTGRGPPRDHRGRATLTRTLEVCRC